MRPFLDDRCLSNFMAIYRAKNLKRAAEDVGLTQPAMSKSLSRLEQDVGVRLFVRKNNGLKPTAAAHELFDCATRIEARTRQSLLRMVSFENALDRSLRIGAGPMWSWLRLPCVVHEFLERYPHVKIDLVTAPMNFLIDELEAGRIDLAVGEMSEAEVPKGFTEQKFPPVPQWPFVRLGHPLSQQKNVKLDDLVQFPWTGFFNNEVFSRKIKTLFDSAGLKPPETPLRSGSIASIMSIASLGDYITVLPDDFGSMAQGFGLTRIASETLEMWNLDTSVIFSEDERTEGPIAELVELMKQISSVQASTSS